MGEEAIAEHFEAALAPVQMVALGIIVLAAHLGGRICRRLKLSEVTGQILGGALAGPYVLHASGILTGSGGRYDDALHAFHFFIFVFLGMVAFAIGEELHISRLGRVGRKALVITLIQGLLTWGLITAGAIGLAGCARLEAMLIASIGMASAPAVTFVLMNQLRVEGRLRQMAGSLIVLGDLFGILTFSILLQLCRRQHLHETGLGRVAWGVIGEIGWAALLGGAVFLVLRVLVRRRAALAPEEAALAAADMDMDFFHRILAAHPSPSAEILLVVLGSVSIGTGLAYHFHLPFLITAMLAGFLVANFHSHAIFDSLKIDSISAVFNLAFFALVGASLSLSDLRAELGWLILVYILARIVGKLAGGWLGARLVREDRKITACLPFLILPQAGVGAVEAVYASSVLNNPGISGTVLPAIVFFEVVGVYMVDWSLRRWRSWVADEERVLQAARGRGGAAEAAARLLSYLDVGRIRPGLRATDKSALLEELVDLARGEAGQHIDRAQALQLLIERERLAPTGFGHGIAIPHCRLIGLEKPVLIFGRHPQGVVFGGVDEEPCDLILLILSSARDPGEHLRLLASAAHVLGNDAHREKLRSGRSSQELLEIIGQIAKG